MTYIQKELITQKHKTRQQTPTPPACRKTTACRAEEIKARMSLPQDAGEPEQCSCATQMPVTFNLLDPELFFKF